MKHKISFEINLIGIFHIESLNLLSINSIFLCYRQDHEERCEYRNVYCPHFDCQPQKIQFSLFSITNHYNSIHQKSIQFQKHNLHFPDQFRIKLNPSKILYHNALLYYNDKLLYVFIGKYYINITAVVVLI